MYTLSPYALLRLLLTPPHGLHHTPMSSRKRGHDDDDRPQSALASPGRSKNDPSSAQQPDIKRLASSYTPSHSPLPAANRPRSASVVGAVSSTVEMDSQDALNDLIDTFQKEALWRELAEARRVNQRISDQLSYVERVRQQYTTRLTAMISLMATLNEDMAIECAVLQPAQQANDSQTLHMDEWNEERWRGLEMVIAALNNESSDLVGLDQDDALLRYASSQQRRLLDSCKTLLKRFVDVKEELTSHLTKNPPSSLLDITPHSSTTTTQLLLPDSVNTSSALYKQITSQNTQSRIELAQMQTQLLTSQLCLQESQQRQDILQEEIMQLRRQLNRQSSRATSIVFQIGEYQANGTLHRPESTRSDIDPAHPVDPTLLATTLISGSTSVSPTQVDDPVTLQSTVSGQDIAIGVMAAKRLVEIESLKNEVTMLQKQNDQLTLDQSVIPDTTILQHPLTEALRKELLFTQSEAARWKRDYDAAFTQLNQQREDHDKYMDQLAGDRKVQNEQYLNQCNALNAEAVRLRQARDEAQASREVLLAEKKTGMKSTEEVRRTANIRKIRIDMLQNETKRLRTAIATDTGLIYLSTLFNTFNDESENNTLLTEYEATVSKLQTEATVLRTELDALKLSIGGSIDAQQAIEAAIIAKKELANAQEQLARYEALSGNHNNSNVDNRDITVLLKEKQQMISALERQLQLKNEEVTVYINEMNSLAEEYTKIDANTAKHALQLVEYEDQLTKMVHEKMKLAERCQNLKKKCELLKNEAALAKRETNKYMEHAKKVDEREKAVQVQLISLERELRIASEAVKLHKEKVLDMARISETSKSELERLKTRQRETEEMLNKRTEQYVNERHDRRRAQEEAETLKFRTDKAQKSSSANISHHDDKSDLLAQYRQLLMCSTCNSRFKDTVITRCMHTFCRQCVQDRIDTRQRKCATCGEGFGTADVQTIYL